MVNYAQDFVAVKKYEILQFSLIPIVCKTFTMLFSKDLKNWTTSKNPLSNIADVSALKTT